RTPPLAFDQSERNINSISRDDCVMRLEVRGSVVKLRPRDLAPFDHAALYSIRPSEHAARRVYAASGQQAANHRRTDAVPANHYLRHFLSHAAQLVRHPFEQSEIAFAVMPEREAMSEIDFARVETTENNIRE